MCLGICTLTLAFAATATASSGWTPAQAAAKVKATYTTVDPLNYAFMDAKLEKLLAAGTPETDPQVIALRRVLATIEHQARVTSATCKGAGKAVGARYSRFHCTVNVQGVARIPPDWQVYMATKKLTVTASPFRVLAGWR